MKTWTLTINAIFPTANVFLRMPSLRKRQRHYPGCTKHRQDLRDAWYWMILEKLALCNRTVSPATKKRYVKVISYRRGDPDPPNLVLPSDKLVLDNLVKMGALVDDNAKWCKMDPPEIRKADAHGLRTVIEIREG